jgi:hypothetical protein
MTTNRTANEIASKIASDTWALATLHIDEDAFFEGASPEEISKIVALTMVHLSRLCLDDITPEFIANAPAMLEVEEGDSDLNDD